MRRPRLPTLPVTIKSRIALAFLAMATVCITLGVLAVAGANRAGTIVTSIYDRTLVTNNFARAAANDFATLQATFARGRVTNGMGSDEVALMSGALQASFDDDLAIAAETDTSPEMTGIVTGLRTAQGDWRVISRHIGPASTPADWKALDRSARAVEAGLETLVRHASDEGYANRRDAQGQVKHDTLFAIAGVGAAVFISGVVALMLYWRISAPIGQAVRFAQQIAGGSLDGEPPSHSRDEIGQLIEAMVVMRANIAAMMAEQVVLRQKAHARFAEALEGSRDGVLIVDHAGTIQIANGRAIDCLGLTRADLGEMTQLASVLAKIQRQEPGRAALVQMDGDAPETDETQLPDGRWIRGSRHRTAEGGLVALFADITAIKEQQDKLAEANLTLDAALDNMSQGLCLYDADDRLKLANSRFRAMFGFPEAHLRPGTRYGAIVAHAVALAGGAESEVERVLRHERTVIRRRRGASRSVTIGARTIAITQQPMAEGGWIATYEDVTERKRAESEIAFLANHDALTRLPNRMMFAGKVEEAIVRARRGTVFAIHCLDLDLFKQVNDTLGHAVGDQLLLAVADRLNGCIRDGDVVARLGGDEFAILQVDAVGSEQVDALAKRVVDALGHPYVIDGHDVTIGVSVGIAMSPHDGLNHSLLLKSADAALYRAKQDGRRTWRFFEPAMDETLRARHALESDLRRAVANQEFEVFFQPLLDVRSAKIRSFEALARWRHPTRGLVPPDDFIPIAEETGIIREIGQWVLEAACREAMRWPADVCVAVNVSTIQLREPGFVGAVTRALSQSGLSPTRLELEITESVFMANTTKIMPMLASLRGIGVRFAMDDFGTGYSSLSTLRAFPFDKIKIDRSFIRDLSAAEAAGQIIRTIIALGRSLGMRVTAEGVETRAQLQFLQGEGCDEVQGYLVGRPMPTSQLIAWLASDADRSSVELAA